MRENPFRPPASATPPPESPTSTLRAVFFGLTVACGCYYLAGSLAGWTYAWALVLTGTPVAHLAIDLYSSPPFLLFCHALAAASAVTGGFWATRVDDSHARRPAFICGVLSVLLGLVLQATPFDLPIPTWSRLLGLVLPIPMYLVGASRFRRGLGDSAP
jgi:hypothetical protein